MPAMDEPLPLFDDSLLDRMYGKDQPTIDDELFAENLEAEAREARLRSAGKTSREDAERELDELRARLAEGPKTVTDRVRLRASIRVIAGGEWAELAMQIRLTEQSGWLNVMAADHPLLLARHGQENEEHIIRVVERFLTMDAGIFRYTLGKFEMRIGQGVSEYRAWLTFQSQAGVAVRTREDGMLNVYGL